MCDDDLDFAVAVLKWIEETKKVHQEILWKQDDLRMMTNDEGRCMPDLPREEGVVNI